ncbi:hypothetical protein SH139x_005490 [Planctomycetaceae bacterium SH139]
MDTLPFEHKSRLIVLISVCCIGFFVVDVATPSCFDDPFPAMLVLGVVTAQLTVICVWGTLVRGTFWIRLPWTLLLLVISWCGFAIGIEIKGKGDIAETMLSAAVMWLFGFVVSFVPLKIAAICFRWQIIQESAIARNMVMGSNYAIRDMMIGMLLLALSLGIGRAMLPDEDFSLSRAVRASVLGELEGLIAITIYGIASLLVKLPCIWIALGEKIERIKSRIGVWVVYCFLLAICEFGLLIGVLGDPGSEAIEFVVGIIFSHQLMGAIMLAVCLSLRGLGYRLERAYADPAVAAA